MASGAEYTPELRISEVGGRVRLGLEGFGDVEGATLQDAADELVSYMLSVAQAFRTSGIGPFYTECAPDPRLMEFVWVFGELAASGADPRELLFGSKSLAA